MSIDIAGLIQWINERESIRMRKAVLEDYAETGVFQLSDAGRQAWHYSGKEQVIGEEYPDAWSLACLTDDPVLRDYRFCNVRREDDRVTRWIREHIIVPHWDHPNLWLMLCIARTINWPPALQELMRGRTSWPWFDDFSPARLGEALQVIKDRGDKVYSNAYMIRAESHPKVEWFSWPKQHYIAKIVIGRLWEARDQFKRFHEESTHAETVWEWLQTFIGWGPFMSGQVITDMKHTRYLKDCEDFNTWTALGPGSRRGLNRLRGRNVAGPLTQALGLEEMVVLKRELDKPGTIWSWLQPMELSDVQNICCEWDKYQRAKLGQGRPKSNYVPGRGY